MASRSTDFSISLRRCYETCRATRCISRVIARSGSRSPVSSRGSDMVSHYDRLVRVASRAHIPLAVLFEVTHRCNLGCSHCYLTEGPMGRPKPTRDELTFDEIRRVFDQLADAGTLFLTLSGGEVFMRRDFLEIVAHARACGFSVTVFTTGTLLTPETAAQLADLPPLSVA